MSTIQYPNKVRIWSIFPWLNSKLKEKKIFTCLIKFRTSFTTIPLLHPTPERQGHIVASLLLQNRHSSTAIYFYMPYTSTRQQHHTKNRHGSGFIGLSSSVTLILFALDSFSLAFCEGTGGYVHWYSWPYFDERITASDGSSLQIHTTNHTELQHKQNNWQTIW